ncbi:CHAT domain-containing protein [Tenacibaculum sp. MAR_2009_124]|uniref:CHAT domain-containing protein n=1 Tax=Tenacibaculum sp. MAR_2009_124 TaxID=1250059 RepID=UPI0008967B14|nr:CHAT domain-containing protein [Tenacibaculum sp. MAR_2009_124]SEC24335.1 CHAT domain-containing protein [Tenacibaculum sp. MAR_2009_124]
MNLKKKITLVFILASFSSFGQNSEIKKAEKLLDSARTMLKLSKPKEALVLNKEALYRYIKESPNNIKIAEVYAMLGNIHISLRNLDSIKYYTDKGFEVLQGRQEADNEIKGLLNYNIGTLRAIKGDYKGSYQYLEKALEYQNKSSETELNHFNKAKTYANLSNVTMLLRDFENAIKYNGIAVEIFMDIYGEDHPNVAGLYLNRGNIYYHQNSFSEAEIFYKKSLRIHTKHLGETHPVLAHAYGNLGNIYRENEEYDKSLDYFDKAILIYSNSFGPMHPKLADFYNSIGLSYKELKKYTQASSNFKKALSIWETHLGSNHQYIGYVYGNIGNTDFELGNYDSALESLKKAEDVFQNQLDEKHLDVTKIHTNIARIYIKKGNYSKAISILNKALTKVESTGEIVLIDIYLRLAEAYIMKKDIVKSKQFLEKANHQLTIKNNRNFNSYNFYGISDVNDFFETKIKVFKKIKEQSGNNKYLDSLNIVYNDFIKYQDRVQNIFSRKSSKNFRISSSYNLYEGRIKHLLDSNTESGELKAFEISEKVNGRLLLENFYKLDAKKLLDLPDSILVTENQLESKLFGIEKRIYEENTTINEDTLFKLKNSIFDLKKEQDEFHLRTKKNYPEYYDLIYKKKSFGVDYIQSNLEDDQCLLKYFVGEDNIFLFFLSKNEYVVKEIKKDFPLNDWITKFKKSITSNLNNSISDSGENERSTKYRDLAFNLYNKLIFPVADKLTKRVIIIPDGSLSLIPFGALLTEITSEEIKVNEFPYLLKKHQISYNYSSMLNDYLKTSHIDKKEGLLAFAPSFENGEPKSGFGELKYNIREVEAISNVFNGDVYKSGDATKSNFINYAKDYKIVHLSTHAKANDSFGDYSYIIFNENQDDLNDANKLYASELYNLRLNNEMVVLSACETGVGELKQGEGIISLARAFTYAGTKSTVTSLWNVNDSQTEKLMILFYKNLRTGMRKDEALNKAKLSYIENENLVNPYYWAGFIPSGNMDPITLTDNNSLYYVLLLFMTIVVVFIFFYKNKIKKSHDRF